MQEVCLGTLMDQLRCQTFDKREQMSDTVQPKPSCRDLVSILLPDGNSSSILQAKATSWTTREGNQPFLKIFSRLTKPPFWAEFVRIIEYIAVSVDEMATHLHYRPLMAVSSQNPIIG